MKWRDKASPIIASVLASNLGADEKQLRKLLREAYPFGQRQHHPYEIWCDEIRRQLGLKPKAGDPARIESLPGQMEMFA